MLSSGPKEKEGEIVSLGFVRAWIVCLVGAIVNQIASIPLTLGMASPLADLRQKVGELVDALHGESFLRHRVGRRRMKNEYRRQTEKNQNRRSGKAKENGKVRSLKGTQGCWEARAGGCQCV